MMDGVLAFLGGDYKQVLDVLNREMMDYAAKMQYERAAVIRDKSATCRADGTANRHPD